MKCIRDLERDRVVRVSNERAEYLVNVEGWEYVPKESWKLSGRKYK